MKHDGRKLLKQLRKHTLPIGTSNMYLYIKKTRVGKKTYKYLILEQYVSKNENNGKPRRTPILKLPIEDAIKLLLTIALNPSIMKWCGGWDLNPRRPTPSGPQPDPFDLARAPPHTPRQYAAKQVLKPYASPSFILCLAPGAGFEPARPAGGSGSPDCLAGNWSRAHRLGPLGHPGASPSVFSAWRAI